MSVQNPKYSVARWSVVGMEGMFVKMFDPPTYSPETPDNVLPTNPVPEVMAAAGIQEIPRVPHTVQRDLMHGVKVPTWDGRKQLTFFTFSDDDNPAASLGTNGSYPGPTIRVPRGVIFHCETSGKGPPPHTIHWHGIEPTPMNDGVGHCSMEIGHYVYQFQPNFVGTYFYHCHRNTMQHFEFGLFGMLLVETPDAYFATQVNPEIPIGAGRDGKRRTAANLTNFPQFPGFNGNPLTAADPWTGDPRLKFATDPHAMTIVYDVEALWVISARDSTWSDLADNARQTFPKHGTKPGINDNFHTHAGDLALPGDFFAFNDYRADYWFVTGLSVPAQRGGRGRILVNATVDPEMMSGVSGVQVPINAQTNQTVLLRCLNGAYNSMEITFPVNVVIIAWDGRALGGTTYDFNEAYLVQAGTPIMLSTARRFDALIRSAVPVDDVAVARMIDTRGQGIDGAEEVVVTIEIPIHIGGQPQEAPTSEVRGRVTDSSGRPLEGVSVEARPVSQAGSAARSVLTDSSGNYQIQGLINSSYNIAPSLLGFTFTPQQVVVTVNDQNVGNQNFTATVAVGLVTLAAGKASPQPPGIPHGVTFTASVIGGSAPFEYRFYLSNGQNEVMVRDFSTDNRWTWDTLVPGGGSFTIFVHVRQAGATSAQAEKIASTSFVLSGDPPTFEPNSYSIQEALEALRINVGLKNPSGAELARMDVAPFIEGVVQPDGLIDLRDVLNILRMAVGLTPL